MNRIFKNVKREQITLKDTLVSLSVIAMVALMAVLTEQWHKDSIKIVGFMAMLLVVVHLRRYFFPFVFASISCYLMASAQVLWSPNYKGLEITSILWFCGDVLLPIGFFHLIYRLIYKYEIVKRTETTENEPVREN